MAVRRTRGPRKGWTPQARARREKALGRNPWGGYNHNSLGCEFARVCSWERAIFEFERAVDINPWEALFKVNLSRAHLASGEVEKARKLAEAALEQSPKLGAAMFALGMVMERLGSSKSAVSWYRKCLDSDPGLGIKHEAEENLEVLLARRS
jgi:tetratricopeptide (TPR) repeat protein